MQIAFMDPRQAVLVDTGYALDAIGSLESVRLRREEGETDDHYRKRLAAKLLAPNDDRIVAMWDTGNHRWYQASDLQPPVFQRKFWVRLSDGSEGHLWING